MRAGPAPAFFASATSFSVSRPRRPPAMRAGAVGLSRAEAHASCGGRSLVRNPRGLLGRPLPVRSQARSRTTQGYGRSSRSRVRLRSRGWGDLRSEPRPGDARPDPPRDGGGDCASLRRRAREPPTAHPRARRRRGARRVPFRGPRPRDRHARTAADHGDRRRRRSSFVMGRLKRLVRQGSAEHVRPSADAPDRHDLFGGSVSDLSPTLSGSRLAPLRTGLRRGRTPQRRPTRTPHTSPSC
jgi:hypothetical protein